MKLSCLPVSFFDAIINGKMSVADWAHMGAEVGLDAIDLSILFIPDHSLKIARDYRQQIEDAGVSVAMLSTYPDFTHPNDSQRDKELELETRVVEVAAELGAELVRITAGQAHPTTSREHGIAWAIEGMTTLAERTHDMGLTLVYENHGKPGIWTYTDFSQPPDIFLEIVRGIADSTIGINFDTANATAFADNPLALLNEVIDRVVSVHAADTAVRGELQHVLLGTGLTPFELLFGNLKQTGWDNWICIEEASFKGREGVEKAAEFVRQVWNSVQSF